MNSVPDFPSLVRTLADSLASAQAALLAFDLPAFQSHTARQQELCQTLQAVPDFPNDTLEMHGTRNKIFHQIRIYTALLRRMRRTNEIFCRALTRADITYTVPPVLR